MNQPILNPATAANAISAIDKARQRLAELKAQQMQKQAEQARNMSQLLASTSVNTQALAASATSQGWKLDTSVAWNEEQLAAINMGLSGKSFCLIGAAGTGKTTTLRGLVSSLMLNKMLPPIPAQSSTKWLAAGSPGIVLVSFTNMAVRQIARQFSDDITCVTIHKLIEFAPHFYEAVNDKGMIVNKVEFKPSRNKANPLPRSLKTIVVDESSMVDTVLFQQLLDALPDPAAVQFIYLGDLNQLPPVYGRAILGRKLLEQQTVELTQVYRQALQSPIISLAIKLKNGESIPITDKLTDDRGKDGKLTIHPWSKAISGEDAAIKAAGFLKAAIVEGVMDPWQDIALCPQNVGFGTLELNKDVASFLGNKRDAMVFEIIAGFQKHYLAVGDKVLVNKREAIIRSITRNHSYTGTLPMNPLKFKITRWGGAEKRTTTASPVATYNPEDEDFDAAAFLESLVTSDDVENRVHAASHQVLIQFADTRCDPDLIPESEREELLLQSAAEINDMLLGYVITVHKSQGSEWRKVFILTHKDHSKMCSRELLYTAVTRARNELYVICEPDRGIAAGTLTKAARNPRLKGNTLQEKLIALKALFDQEDAEKQ